VCKAGGPICSPRRASSSRDPCYRFLSPAVSGWTRTGTNQLPLQGPRRPFLRAFRANLTAVRNTCLRDGHAARRHVISYGATAPGSLSTCFESLIHYRRRSRVCPRGVWGDACYGDREMPEYTHRSITVHALDSISSIVVPPKGGIRETAAVLMPFLPYLPPEARSSVQTGKRLTRYFMARGNGLYLAAAVPSRAILLMQQLSYPPSQPYSPTTHTNQHLKHHHWSSDYATQEPLLVYPWQLIWPCAVAPSEGLSQVPFI
jgi:hypothetical protein